MAIRLEEYNKNQRVYNRSQNENKNSNQIEKNESFQNTTQYVRGKDSQDTRVYDNQYTRNNETQYVRNDNNQYTRNNENQYIRNNESQYTRSNEDQNSTQYIRNNDIQKAMQYTRKNENQNIAQDIKQGDNPDYSLAMAVQSGASFVRQKGGRIWRIKIVYSIIMIALFLLTPFLITISMTGVIESNISDSLVEVRRVNVKYKNGSQAIDISKYMIGVLASRLSLSNQVEVLKAESIMVRTEIYRCMGDEMSIDSTDLNLTYLSEKEMKSLWGDSYTDNYNLIVDCISATSGKLINCNGQLIEPMYTEVSAGKTRNGAQVFSGSASDYSYLTSVVCEHDIEATDYLTVKTFTYDDFIKPFTEKYGNINISKDNPSQSVQIVSRCSADYILKIQVGNVLMSGEDFANVLNLNSSCLSMETANNSIKITTKGKGNGLGVSIYAADYMAKNGSTCEEILNKFYSNITIMSE